MPNAVASLNSLEVWFVAGTQHLYGDAAIHEVSEHSRQIAFGLAGAEKIPVKVVFKAALTSADAIRDLCLDANNEQSCIGLIAWMHTFSPAQMWIAGLKALRKPLLHLHTQYSRHLPWSTIDMNFMNLNQSAHGDREFGFIGTRMRVSRKVVVGFWQDDDVTSEIGTWTRAAAAWHDWQQLKIARFGDNMRDVAVTEGDKVEAQVRLGYAVKGYGVGDLVRSVRDVRDDEIDSLVSEYDQSYTLAAALRAGGDKRQSLREAARLELGLRAFLENGGFKAFTDTFEDLHGLLQLPGIAVQRLMTEGYGFGAEGDWKTAALVRAMKVMSAGLEGGTSFMEHYIYDFGQPQRTLAAHMLEVCPSIAEGRPSLEIHPLAIGGKADPVRAVFTARSGPGVNVSVVDLGSRFRMVLNEVDVVPPDQPLEKLPVARAVWIPRPNLKLAAYAWIYAGGAHHTSFSQALTAEHLQDFAAMASIEFLRIGKDTSLDEFRNEVRWNEAYYLLRQGLR